MKKSYIKMSKDELKFIGAKVQAKIADMLKEME